MRTVACLIVWLVLGTGITSWGVEPAEDGSVGPLLGHVGTDSAQVWYRAGAPGTYLLGVQQVGVREQPRAYSAEATPEHDLCVVWNVDDLEPDTAYRYFVATEDETILAGDASFVIRTPPASEAPTLTRLAFGSCAREDAGSARVWDRIGVEEADAVVLLGDTPYIDSIDRSVQRRRHREFLAVPALQRLLRSRSLYATWDDHDFGRNDTDGNLAGKEESRRVFLDYRALPSAGDGQRGVYSRFRRGPIEVFLLDARTFAGTEASEFDPARSTLLGRAQWAWLRDHLVRSDAPFKVLASGMIWNKATRPGKPDHWMSYPHEREALFRFLGDNRIDGVVLVGGDIHRTRVLKHRVAEQAGYPLYELITSPIHDGIMASANAPHPDLVFDAGEPHSFLLLTGDTQGDEPMLTAEMINADGRRLHTVTLEPSDLTRSAD